MFESLNRFFDRHIAAADTADDEERRLQVATCALLLEAAHADDDFSADERALVEKVLAKRFGLSPEQTAELVALAEEERRRQQDLYEFARLINDTYTKPRKLAVIELLWDVVYSDGVLAAHEDALMHKVARLLGLRNQELMAVKAQVRKRLDQGD